MVTVDPIAHDDVPPLFEGTTDLPFHAFSIEAQAELNGDATIEFDVGELADDIVVVHFDEELEQWVLIESEYDPERGIVTASTSHFSFFGWFSPRSIAVQLVNLVEGHWETVLKEPFKPSCPTQTGPVEIAVDHTLLLVEGCIVDNNPDRPEVRIQNTSLWNLEFARFPASDDVPLTPLGPGEWTTVDLDTASGYPIHILVGTQEYADIEFAVSFLAGFLPHGAGEIYTNQQVRQIAIEVVKNLGTQRADFEQQMRTAYASDDPAGMLTGLSELLLNLYFQRALFDAIITVGSEDGGLGTARLAFSLFSVIVVAVVKLVVSELVEAIVNSLVYGVGMLHMLGANMVVLATGALPQIVISGPQPTPTPVPAPAAPQNVQASLTGDNELTITWERGSGNEDGFELRFQDSEGYGTPFATVGGDTVIHVWSPENRDLFHRGTSRESDVVCIAINAVNAGGASERVEVCVDKPKGPAPPTNVQLRLIDLTHLELTWEDASDNETAFEVFWLPYVHCCQFIGSVEAGATSYVWDGSWPEGWTPHEFFKGTSDECLLVRAVNETGPSEQVMACVDQPSPVTTSEILAPVNVSFGCGASRMVCTLVWTAQLTSGGVYHADNVYYRIGDSDWVLFRSVPGIQGHLSLSMTSNMDLYTIIMEPKTESVFLGVSTVREQGESELTVIQVR